MNKRGWVDSFKIMNKDVVSALAAGDVIFVDETAPNAIRTTGTVGQDLLTGVLFVTSEAIQGDIRRLDEVDIIIVPRAR